MNVDHINQLADFLETLPDESYDQTTYHRTAECGTAACIAGWATTLALDGRDTFFNRWGHIFFECDGQKIQASVHDMAQEWLGIDPDTSDELFFKTWRVSDPVDESLWIDYQPSRTQAIRALRILAETGEFRPEEVLRDTSS